MSQPQTVSGNAASKCLLRMSLAVLSIVLGPGQR